MNELLSRKQPAPLSISAVEFNNSHLFDCRALWRPVPTCSLPTGCAGVSPSLIQPGGSEWKTWAQRVVQKVDLVALIFFYIKTPHLISSFSGSVSFTLSIFFSVRSATLMMHRWIWVCTDGWLTKVERDQSWDDVNLSDSSTSIWRTEWRRRFGSTRFYSLRRLLTNHVM